MRGNAKIVRFSLRVPSRSRFERIREAARREKVSINDFLLSAADARVATQVPTGTTTDRQHDATDELMTGT